MRFVYTVVVDPQDGRDRFIDNVYPTTSSSRESIKNRVEGYEKEGCEVEVYREELTPQGRKTIGLVYPSAERFSW